MNHTKLSPDLQEILRRAEGMAKNQRSEFVLPEHIFFTVANLDAGMVPAILDYLKISPNKIKALLEEDLKFVLPTSGSREVLDPTPKALKILEAASFWAQELNSDEDAEALAEHVLLACVSDESPIGKDILANIGLTSQLVRKAISEMAALGNVGGITPKGGENSGGVGQQAGAGRLNPGGVQALLSYCQDLTKLAAEGKLAPVIGRESEIESVTRTLACMRKSNPLIIGEPGVGKTALVEGLAQRIYSEDVPRFLVGKTILSLDVGSLIAGASYRGEFEERLKNVVDGVCQADGKIILFIDELHVLMGAGGQKGGADAANLLKPALARGEFQLIGATTRDEYAKNIEKDAAFERRFAVIVVDEPSPAETREILGQVIGRFEEHHGVKFDDAALDETVRLAVRYLRQRRLPDSAFDIVDNAAAEIQVFVRTAAQQLEKGGAQVAAIVEGIKQRFGEDPLVRNQLVGLLGEGATLDQKQIVDNLAGWIPLITPDAVAAYVSGRTGVPVSRVAEGEASKLINMEKLLGENVIGQNEAVHLLAKAVRRSRAGFKDPKRPIGSFLFFGPTGVGKTYLAKMLAQFLFDDEKSIVRIDMSELKDAHDVARLLGAAPGLVGYEEGGRLTEPIRKNPYSVVLFDEIEKANPAIYDLLLQVLDEGRLEDGQNRLADFSNTVIILTSNVGAQEVLASYREGRRLDQEQKQSLGLRVFSPEQLNRIDELVPFYPYSKDEVFQIIDLEVGQFEKQMKLKGYTLKMVDAAKGILYKQGNSTEFGIRPLRNEIKRLVIDQVADIVIRENPPEGAVFVVDSVAKEIRVSVQ